MTFGGELSLRLGVDDSGRQAVGGYDSVGIVTGLGDRSAGIVSLLSGF